MRVNSPANGVVRYRSSGDRLAWKSSIPISAAVCIGQPGSVNRGGTWQRLQSALPLNTACPRAAAAGSKLPGGGFGAARAS